MSAEAIHLFQLAGQSYSSELVKMELPRDADPVARRSSVDFVYRVLDTPHPTPDDVRREFFLLDCD